MKEFNHFSSYESWTHYNKVGSVSSVWTFNQIIEHAGFGIGNVGPLLETRVKAIIYDLHTHEQCCLVSCGNTFNRLWWEAKSLFCHTVWRHLCFNRNECYERKAGKKTLNAIHFVFYMVCRFTLWLSNCSVKCVKLIVIHKCFKTDSYSWF